MPKTQTHTVQAPNSGKNVVTIDVREIERKIRRQSAPGVRVHRSKKAYNRKLKHPKTDTLRG